MPTPLIPNPTTALPQMAVDSSQLTGINSPSNNTQQNPFLENSFNKTSLDLEDRFPFGGPINDPNSNFEHFYTPQKPFTTTPEGEVRGDGKLKFRTDSTDLDVEDPLPNGGPINIPYSTKVGSEIKSFSTTHPFTPRNTYADSFNPIPPGILR